MAGAFAWFWVCSSSSAKASALYSLSTLSGRMNLLRLAIRACTGFPQISTSHCRLRMRVLKFCGCLCVINRCGKIPKSIFCGRRDPHWPCFSKAGDFMGSGSLPGSHAYVPIQDGNFELPDDSPTGTVHSLFALLQQPTFQMRLDPIAENASVALTFRSEGRMS